MDDFFTHKNVINPKVIIKQECKRSKVLIERLNTRQPFT